MNTQFTTTITSKRSWFDFNLKELLHYKDLIFLFVRRTFVSQYKQTILGPIWAIIQPLFTTVIFTVIFGNMAGLAPGEVPTFVFYLCGSVGWTYFSGCLTATANTFTANASIMGKVYFPRLVMPVSTVIAQLISFGIQFVFFLLFWLYYLMFGTGIEPNPYALLTPVLVLQMACLGLGFGIIISALTTKYRDLAMLVGFGVQIWMYLTPVAYDISIIPEKYIGLYMLNPMTAVINTMRYGFLGVGSFDGGYYLLSWIVTASVLFLGVILFNRVEKTFMDTV